MPSKKKSTSRKKVVGKKRTPLTKRRVKKKSTSRKKVVGKKRIPLTKRRVKKKSTSRKKVVGKKRTPLTKRRVKKFRESEKIVGEKNIKSGRILIGETSELSPTKGSFKRVRDLMGEVSKPGDFTKFSYDIKVVFTNKRGKEDSFRLRNRGIPKFSLKEMRRRKMSKMELLAAHVDRRVRGGVFRGLNNAWGKYPDKKKREKMSAKKARDILERVKSRNAKFTFQLYRDK